MITSKLLVALLVAAVASLSSALTDEQIVSFMTTASVETNTGQTGMVSIVTADRMHTITSNGVPDHPTPEYPNQGNPNDIVVQAHQWTVPVNPTVATSTTELPLGPISVAINGIPFFNPYTAKGEDAVLTETFDSCDGHPTNRGVYHYHKQPSSCVFDIVSGEPSPLIGVALDGFPIYGPIDENGVELTSADLDECHGRFVDGKYRYHTTADFPYIMGCFKGTYSGSAAGGRPPPGQGGGNDNDNSGGAGGHSGLKTIIGVILLGCTTAAFSINST
ncbi:uncharacterized protein LOC110983391 isoform X2 [Acanthaster planci]|nr:uncharacterized protein LOC110983391 isoform X2 [Acanthaster planci]XP_022098317.1 uncharacterized protein LOC110983391 isoform X2 [Acanthaster planci]